MTKPEDKADRNMPNGPSQPGVPLPVYALVPCFYCHTRESENFQAQCARCGGVRYLRVDPEKCPIWEPTV